MKKNFLFGLLALMLAWFWFGGISMAADCTDSAVAKNITKDVCYSALNLAIQEVSDGDTITLLKGFDYNSVITVGNNFTFDFNWYTVATTVKNFFTVNGWKKLTINDTSGVTKGWINSTQGGIFKVTNWSVEINWWKFIWKSVLIVNWGTASATVNYGDFEWQQDWNSTAIQATKWAEITINDWIFKAGVNASNDKPQKVIYAWDDSNPCSSTPNNSMKWWTINVNGWYFEWRLSKSNWWYYHIHGWTFKVLPDPTDSNFSAVWITAWVGCNYENCEEIPAGKDEPLSCQKIIGIAPMLEEWYYAEEVEGENDTYKVIGWDSVKVEFKNDDTSAPEKNVDVILYIKKWEKIGQNKPTDPTIQWKTFGGWFDTSSKQYTADSEIDADVVLSAKWWHNVTLAGIDWATLPQWVTSPVFVEDNKPFDSTIKPTKAGSAFLWWYSDETTKYAGWNITEDTTLTAHWFDNISSLMHDSDAFVGNEANNWTSKKATYTLSEDWKTLTVTWKIDYDAVHCSGEWENKVCYNRYGIAVKLGDTVDNLKAVFPDAKFYLNWSETANDVWEEIEWATDQSWPAWIYWYPKVLKSNQTDKIKIQWNDNFAEEYTINVENAILDLPSNNEVDQSEANEETSALTSDIIIPTYDTEEDDVSDMFTVTVWEWTEEMIYEWIPASAVTFTEPWTDTVAASDMATNSNFTAQVLKIFQMNFASHATFSKPLWIKLKTDKNAKIKVKHTWDTNYGFNWLTTVATATCTNGVASSPYNGAVLPADANGFVTIYTCGASEFVAYTETQTSGTSSWGGGGSSSYSCKNLPDNAVANNTTKPTKSTNYSYSTDTSKVCTFQCKSGYTWNSKDAKCEKSDANANTWDTAKLDEQKADETKTSEEAKAAANAQALKDGYSQEFIDAYNFARKNNITTKDTIREADMDAPLTRIAMAKMLSQYAINVLGKTPDTTKTISFPDVSAELDSQYNNGVTLAYQLWIMWIGIEKFRPDDLVTRAEFGTALSRMLYGLADWEWNEWYKTHLDKLMEEKIITVDTPNLKELRGYVMIMLMRSAQ